MIEAIKNTIYYFKALLFNHDNKRQKAIDETKRRFDLIQERKKVQERANQIIKDEFDKKI